MAMMAALACGRSKTGGFSSGELELLNGTDSIMRVLTVEDSLDHAVLRAASRDFSSGELISDEFKKLGLRMISTVTHPSQDGVGIAGPQVGLNRRIVAVQRFDKEGEPFEVYANVRIVWMSDSLAYGPEGCLSVPDRRGNVLRSQQIVIEYADLSSICQNCDDIPMTRDTVSGFTAVIFQHEIDHLEGVLYIDRL
ncbi:MAG: peptide deformylase [Bacteroidales bacterium]|nr:peptide deformylase [Bacteroidales bacterium]